MKKHALHFNEWNRVAEEKRAKTIMVIAFIRQYENSLEFAQRIPVTEKSIRFLRDIPQAEDDM